MAKRGNPYAIVRLEPEVMRIIQERSQPRERGRGGGVSQYLRQIVYAHLGLGAAPCFGEAAEAEAAARSQELQRSSREPHAAPELA